MVCAHLLWGFGVQGQGSRVGGLCSPTFSFALTVVPMVPHWASTAVMCDPVMPRYVTLWCLDVGCLGCTV